MDTLAQVHYQILQQRFETFPKSHCFCWKPLCNISLSETEPGTAVQLNVTVECRFKWLTVFHWKFKPASLWQSGPKAPVSCPDSPPTTRRVKQPVCLLFLFLSSLSGYYSPTTFFQDFALLPSSFICSRLMLLPLHVSKDSDRENWISRQAGWRSPAELSMSSESFLLLKKSQMFHPSPFNLATRFQL